MTMASLTVVLMAAAELSLDVSPAAPCVTSTSLEAGLVQRGVRVTKATASTLKVKVHGDATRVVLSGARGSKKYERSVPVAQGDCDAVTRVTLALLESWASTAVAPPSGRVADAGVALNADVRGATSRAEAGGSARIGARVDGAVAPDSAARIDAARSDGGSSTEAAARIDAARGDAGVAKGFVARIDVARSDAGVVTESATRIDAARGDAGLVTESAARIDAARGAGGVVTESTARINAARGDAGVVTESTARIDAARGDEGVVTEVAARIDAARGNAGVATEAAARGAGGTSTEATGRIDTARGAGGTSTEAIVRIDTARADAGAATEAGARIDAARGDAGVATESTARGAAGTSTEATVRIDTARADAGAATEAGARIDAARRDTGATTEVAARTARSRVDTDSAARPDETVARIGTTSLNDSAPAPLSLEVTALGGVAYDPLHLRPGSQVATGTGQLALRGAVGRWGLLLDVGFDSARSHTVSTATATGSTQWLSLSLSVAFQPLERFSFDLALGVRGWRLAAVSTGVDVPAENSQFTGGGVVSVGLNLHLVGPLHLQLRPWTSLRLQRVNFVVSPLGTVLPIEPWTLGALAGALLRFN